MLDRDLEPNYQEPFPHMECPDCGAEMNWNNVNLHFECITCDEWFQPKAVGDDDDEYDEHWVYVYDC